MTDQDLRALAAKLLKHYVADSALGTVVEGIVANSDLDRGEDTNAPEITAEERNLLNLLGGYMAEANESAPLALTAQGCGDDGGGDGGDGGDDGGDDDGDDAGDDDAGDDEGDDEGDGEGESDAAADTGNNAGFGDLSGITGSGWSGEFGGYGDLSGISASDFGGQPSENAGAFGLSGPADASGYAGSYGGAQGSYGDLSGISAAGFGSLSAGLNAGDPQASGPEAESTNNENQTQGNPYGDLSGVLGFGVNQSVGPAGAFGISGRGDPSGYNATSSSAYGALGGNPNAGSLGNTEGAFGLGGPESAGNYGGAYSGSSQSAGTSAGGQTSGGGQAASGGQTAAGGPTAASSTSYNLGPSFLSDPLGWVANKAENVAQNAPSYAVNAAMMGVPVVGTVNTLSGLLGGPTIGGVMQSGTPAGPEDMSADLGGSGSAAVTRGPLSNDSPVVAAPSLGAVTNPISPTYLDANGKLLVDLSTPLKTAALARKYLGSPKDPYTYGYGPMYQYYADGGLVAYPKPPVQPTVASQPTMAYTDGQGLVGAVSAPPGMTPYNSVGSDAPHTSPMAFAPAAAAPTMTPDEPMLATRNINASPVAAPISQNPNLGYSLGMSPLSLLTGMRNV